jgi:hypothetical protein
MSNFYIQDQTGAYLYVNYDLSKLFLWDNRYENGLLNNSGYSQIAYNPGTVLGRVASTGYLVPFSAEASDGSQFVVGVLNDGIIVDPGATVEVAYCVGGDVAADQLILLGNGGADTLETVVTGRSRRVKDCIMSDAAALRIIYGQDLTFADNS